MSWFSVKMLDLRGVNLQKYLVILHTVNIRNCMLRSKYQQIKKQYIKS